MQQDPLLEQLDWFFTSLNWTIAYPNTLVLPLAKPISDHIPCKVVISTCIPKANIFRFENFWPDHPGFMDVVQDAWSTPIPRCQNAARLILAKLLTMYQKLLSSGQPSKIEWVPLLNLICNLILLTSLLHMI